LPVLVLLLVLLLLLLRIELLRVDEPPSVCWWKGVFV
jgi:hypothetical protein